MSDVREEMLSRIRAAVGAAARPREADYATIPRTYRQSASLDRHACVELFADRLVHYDAGVYRCGAGEVAATVGQALAARGRKRLIVPPGLSREWLPRGFEFLDDDRLSHAQLDAIDGAVTGCRVAIALTGTIVLGHSPAEGRRALTLIPDYHLCVVETAQIVETVPEAFRRLSALDPRLLTTISGPSATADIEMTRIKGVHGPRTLDVIILDAHHVAG